jgi:AcrR family transcriptional regulator
MAHRPYKMRKRAETAARTRQRLVEATFQLHTEQGIAATTMHQIAARADVSVGTAYHHFGGLDEVVQACGAYTQEHYRPPGPEAFDGEATLSLRLQALARAYFAFFERLPVLEHVRRDVEKVPALTAFVAGEQAHRRHMVALALDDRGNDEPVVDLIALLFDLPMFTALTNLGHDTAAAADLAAELALSWISTHRSGDPEYLATQPLEDKP